MPALLPAPPFLPAPLPRESEEGVRLPRETADLRGSPGNFRGSPGNFRGSLGNFRGTSGLLFSSTVRELPGKSPKTSGEVRGTSGEVRGLSRSSGEPDSLPVTRQILLAPCSNRVSRQRTLKKHRARRNACSSGSGCGFSCDAPACDAKPLGWNIHRTRLTRKILLWSYGLSRSRTNVQQLRCNIDLSCSFYCVFSCSH